MKTKTKYKCNITPLKGFGVIFIFIFQFVVSFGQQTIYSEPFSNQENKGVTGTNNGSPIFDVAGVSWSIDVSSGLFTASTDYFKVRNGVMEGRDLDGLVYWISPSIDISSFVDISIQLDLSETGNLEDSDATTSEYSLDGGQWTQFDINGSTSNDFTSLTAQQTLLNGSSLQIRVAIINNAGNEYIQLDNVTVSGVALTAPLSPSISSIDEGNEQLLVNFTPGNDGGSSITDFEYSINNGLNWISAGTTSSPILITGLTNGTSYSVQIRGINAIGNGDASNTVVGTPQAIVSIPTLDTSPSISSIGSTSAVLGGKVISDGGASITNRGTLWSTSPTPVSNGLDEGGTSVSAFSHLRSGLTKNTLYFYRAYATNSVGTAYSNDAIFTTLQDPPAVSNGSGATISSITANWTIPSAGGGESFTYEIQLSENTDFSTIVASQSALTSTTSSYVFTSLNELTTYYYRIRSTNAGGNSSWSVVSTAYSTTGNLILLTAIGSSEIENFNSLASSGTSSTLPNGWSLYETDNNANNTYRSGTGSSNTGDSYSFGTNGDRALGGLCTNSLLPGFGVKFKNEVGGALTNLAVQYTGETWRVASNNRSDQLNFQYSLDASGIDDGSATWVDFDGLDYTNPGQASNSGSLQHSAVISDTIFGIDIPAGGTICFRWLDVNVSGSDDGMGIDDFSITPICPSIVTTTNLANDSTCGEISVDLVTDSQSGIFYGEWGFVGGNGFFSDPGEYFSTFTSNTFNQDQNISYINTYGACDGQTSVVVAKFNQPNTTSISPQLESNNSWLWGGLANTDSNIPQNWYKWDGFKWLKQDANTPLPGEDVFILSNTEAGLCVSTDNSIFSNQTINTLAIGSGAGVTLDGTINLAGDLINNGIVNASSSTVQFNGSTTQSITGSPITFNNLTLNNGSALQIAQEVSVIATLTMSSGNISNSSVFTIGTSSANPGSLTYTTGTVLGPLRRYFADAIGSSFFPVGNSSVIRDITINFTSAPGTDQHLTATYVSGLPTNPNGQSYADGLPLVTGDGQLIQNYEDEGYWEINPTNDNYNTSINSAAYNLTLHMNTLSVANDYTKVRIIKSAGSNTADLNHISWTSLTHVSATGNNSDFTVTASGIGFSHFGAGGDKDNNPLPVELSTFNGNCVDNGVEIMWQTESEYNSSHFILEYSRDGEEWAIINMQDAALNSNEQISYFFFDENAVSGNNYYRLTQTDIDGATETFNIINVNCENNESSYFTIYPNPSDGNIHLILNDQRIIGEASIRVLDTKGNVVLKKPVEVKNGINMYILDEEISSGIYYINIMNGALTTKIVKHSIL